MFKSFRMLKIAIVAAIVASVVSYFLLLAKTTSTAEEKAIKAMKKYNATRLSSADNQPQESASKPKPKQRATWVQQHKKPNLDVHQPYQSNKPIKPEKGYKLPPFERRKIAQAEQPQQEEPPPAKSSSFWGLLKQMASLSWQLVCSVCSAIKEIFV